MRRSTLTCSRHDPADEFRKAVADVQPLAAKPRRGPRPASPVKPLPAQRLRDERAVLIESLAPIGADDGPETGEELAFARDGLGPQTLRRLRRGHWVVEDELDLHGLNRDEAAASVAEFLAQCITRHRRCVRIVHGKGLGSPNREPVLKAKLGRWLAARNEVLAYCQAPATQGGGGAALVLLRAPRG
jgi:DNA-nicking Smr family endonuclease